MPALARKAFLIAARDRRVKLYHRLAALDRRIRPSGDDRSGLQQTLPCIRAFETTQAQSARRKEEIADGVRGLHGRDDTEACEARDVRGVENLRVLDAPARLADLSLRGRHGSESLFVEVKGNAIGAITDGVRFDLYPLLQRFDEHRQQLIGFGGEEAGSLWRV